MRLIILIFVFLVNAFQLEAQIIFPLRTPPLSWNVIQAYDDKYSRVTLELQWASFFTYDTDWKISPEIATDIRYLNEQRTEIEIKLNIRKALLWSDSTNISPEDFLMSFKLFSGQLYDKKRIKQTTIYDELGSKLKECKYNPADNALIIYLTEPLKIYHGGLESIFEHVYIMPANIIDQAKRLQRIDRNFLDEPVSSGPYILSELKENEKYIFKINNKYIGFLGHETEKNIQKLTGTVDPVQDNWVSSLQRGDYSFLPTVPFMQYSIINGDREINNRLVPRNRFDALVFNFDPLRRNGNLINQINFRKALAHCIDKTKSIETIIGSTQFATALSGPFPPTYPGYNPDVEDYPYNIDVAQNFLQKIGLVKDPKKGKIYYEGNPLELEILLPAESKYSIQFYHNFESELNKLGIDVKGKQMYVENYTQALFSGEFDIVYVEFDYSNTIPVDELFNGDGLYNYGGYENFLIEKYISTFLDQNNNTDERKNAIRQVHVLAHEDLPWIPLWSIKQITAWRHDEIQNYRIYSQDLFRFVEYWER